VDASGNVECRHGDDCPGQGVSGVVIAAIDRRYGYARGGNQKGYAQARQVGPQGQSRIRYGGDVGRMTEADVPKLRAATEFMSSAVGSTCR
jgi:hypothetical protein